MKKLINNILSISLCLTITLTILYSSLSSSIAPHNIKESIKNNLLSGLIYDDSGNKTEIFNTILRLTTLDEETVIKLMENETADQLITDVVNSIYDYNLTGDASYKYTKIQIINLVEENLDKITTEIDYPLTETQRRETLNYTRNNTQYIIDTIYSTNIGGYQK